jgi:hypothetical protein
MARPGPNTLRSSVAFPRVQFFSKRWREPSSNARVGGYAMSLPQGSRHFLALTLAAFAVLMLASLGSLARAASDAPAPGIVLTEGATYRARLKLGFFQCLAHKDRIGKKLSGSGFTNVRVFMSRRELPADWPPSYRAKAGSCERYAEGVWGRPSAPRRRPSSIDTWWVASPPSP